jgi:heptosyltransferase-2
MHKGQRDEYQLAANNTKVGQIFLKPVAWHHRRFIGALETILGLFVRPVKTDSLFRIEETKRILIFDPGSLGDMILVSPLLHSLRVHLPKAKITLVGKGNPARVLRDKGLIDEWLSVDTPWAGVPGAGSSLKKSPFSWLRFWREMRKLRSESFDLAFASGWSGDFRGNLAIWLTGAKRRVGYGYTGGAFLLTDVAQPDVEHPHVADRNLRLLETIGFSRVKNGGVFRVNAKDAEFSDPLLARHGLTKDDLVIGVHPGAGAEIREWGDQRFAEVARRLTSRFGAKILWFLDPNKPKPMPEGLNAIPLSLSLSQFEAVLSNCKLFICNDSGPMHLAAALRVPVVAIFGAQRPEWFGPWGEGHRVVIRHDVWCRPCADNCIFDEPYCLRLISVDQVMNQAEQALKDLTASHSAATTVL